MNQESRIKNNEKEKKERIFSRLILNSKFLILAKPAQAGFAMLFAVLASSLVLAIGISIFNLTIKEINLSSSGRESQFSFYAADTGIECVFYWDYSGVYSSVFSTPTTPRDTGITPVCNNQNLTSNNWTESTAGVSPLTTTFHLEIADPEDVLNGSYSSPEEVSCAIVTVTKTLEISGIISTKIESRGYNVDDELDGDCNTTSTTLVERAIRVRY